MAYLPHESRWLGIGALLVAVTSWEFYALSHPGWAVYLPRFTTILRAFVEMLLSGELLYHAVQTLLRSLRGYVLGALIGIGLGLLCGLVPPAYRMLGLTIELIRPMPVVATIPIAILFFGMGDRLNVFVIALATTWPVYVNTLQGVRSVSRELINTGMAFRCTGHRMVYRIILPASLPSVVTGLRISLAIAVIVAFISEMLVSRNGLGYLVANSAQAFLIADMYAGILTTGLLGWVLNTVFVHGETWWLRWHKGFTAQVGT